MTPEISFSNPVSGDFFAADFYPEPPTIDGNDIELLCAIEQPKVIYPDDIIEIPTGLRMEAPKYAGMIQLYETIARAGMILLTPLFKAAAYDIDLLIKYAPMSDERYTFHPGTPLGRLILIKA